MGMNPRQMQKMMQRMGMQQQDIEASEVIIKTKDKDLIFSNPQVSKINVMGQETYQIIGEAQERAKEAEIKDEDVKTVAEQAGVSEDEARKALEESKGDLAEAILKLKA